LMREFSHVAFGRFRYWVVVFVCRDFSSSFKNSSLQMGVLDSSCACITHLEVWVFFFPHFCNVATLARGPQTDSVRVRINWRRFCTGWFQQLASRQTCGDTLLPKKGRKFGEFFLRKMRIFSHKFEAVLPFGDFSPKKDRLIWTPNWPNLQIKGQQTCASCLGSIAQSCCCAVVGC
jgi:hypothetical protein